MNERHDPNQQREVPLAGPGTEPEEKGRELAGDQAEGDQVAFRRQGEVDDLGQMTTHVDVYEGELEAGVHDDMPQEPVEETSSCSPSASCVPRKPPTPTWPPRRA